MPIEIPATLHDLEIQDGKGNPVVVAGFGRESTHQGYLHWILTSYRWPGAKKAACLLAKRFGFEIDDNRITLGECRWESYLGNKKIDLILNLYENETRIFKLPIELKTDSGESGKGQFKEFSELAREENSGVSACAAFLLGATSVQDFDLVDFTALPPNELLKIWEPLYDDGPQFLKDWLNAVAMEVARRNLAHEVYKEWKVDGAIEPWWKYGYRSLNHMMMYVLDNARIALTDKNASASWDLYLLRYNVVLNLDSKNKNWQPIKGLDPCQWFFEFNDDLLTLKVWTDKKCDDLDRLKQWVREKRKIILNMEIPNCPKPELPGRTTWTKDTLRVCAWQFDLSKPDELPEILKGITEQVMEKALK